MLSFTALHGKGTGWRAQWNWDGNWSQLCKSPRSYLERMTQSHLLTLSTESLQVDLCCGRLLLRRNPQTHMSMPKCLPPKLLCWHCRQSMLPIVTKQVLQIVCT